MFTFSYAILMLSPYRQPYIFICMYIQRLVVIWNCSLSLLSISWYCLCYKFKIETLPRSLRNNDTVCTWDLKLIYFFLLLCHYVIPHRAYIIYDSSNTTCLYVKLYIIMYYVSSFITYLLTCPRTTSQ